MESYQTDHIYQASIRVTLAGAAINLFLAIGKFFAGYFGRSAVMIADSVHSLSDLITDLVVLVSVKISNKPRDECHPYGHGRAETLGATIIGMILIGVGFGFIIKAVEIIRGGALTVPTNLAIAGAVFSIVIKEGTYRYTAYVGRVVESQVILANAFHHRTDALSSVVALFGIGGAMAGYKICDPIAAIIVAFFIIKVGFDVTWGGIQELMEGSVAQEIREKIEEAILSSEGVVSFHDLKTRRIGKDALIDVHIQVHPYISVSEGHNVAENVRSQLQVHVKNVGEVMVHIDAENDGPGIHYDFNRRQLEEEVRNSIKRVHPFAENFDLRIHYISGKALLEIYVELPPEMLIKEGKEVAEKIRDGLSHLERIQDIKVRLNLVK